MSGGDLGSGILDELGAYGKGQAAGGDELGLQDGMQIESGVIAAVGEALFAVASAEHKEPGAINGDDEASGEAEGIEGLRPDKPPDTPGSQLGKSLRADVTEEVVEGFVDGEGVLVRSGQAIRVAQYRKLPVSQLEVKLPTAAQLEGKQKQAPPTEKFLVVPDEWPKTGVWQSV